MSDASSRRTWYLIAAALIAAWGLLGLIDQPNVPFSGYQTDGDNTINLVRAGSPAEAAGLQVDDHITSIGGISVVDSRALAEQPRPAIGETRTLVVERDGATVDVDLTYGALTGTQRALAYASVILGFVFLVFGLLPYLKAPTRPAELLALTGLGLALAFFSGPYIASYGLRTALVSLTLVAIIFGFAFLMDLMVSYPRPKGWRARSWAPWAIYGPAALVSAVILYVIVASPPATSRLNVAVSTMFGLFVVYYFGSAMVAMIHGWVTATAAERDAYGLTTVLIGVLVGLLPLTLSSLIGVFSPRTVLPGVDFYFLTLGLIPITLWAALSRSGGGRVAAPVAPVAAAAPPPPTGAETYEP
jgi:hypothetical protein